MNNIMFLSAVISTALLFFPAALEAQSLREPMLFREMTSGGNCDTCYWIAADGVIERDTADNLKAFLGYDGVTPMPGIRIHLNSPGGDLIGGVLLGQTIREIQLNTAVSTSVTQEVWRDNLHVALPEKDPHSECSSACVFAFIGGVNRYASKNTPPDEVGFRDLGQLGVHQFYDAEALDDPEVLSRSAKDAIFDQLLISRLLRHLNQMGVSAELLQLASQTPPTDMHFLTEDELTRTRSDSWSVRDLFIRGYRNGVAIVELQYVRKKADYRLEIYCDKGQMKMLANVNWRGSYDIQGHQNWKFFENLTVPSSSEGNAIVVKKLSEDFSQNSDGSTQGKFRFVFQEMGIRDLVKLKRFSFSDWSSRHANDAAKELAFTLPDDFDGLYLLPKACL
jgi:hypothetical protein